MPDTTSAFDNVLVSNYFKSLVNHFFKILPMRESEEQSLQTYMQSLKAELIGCKGVVTELQHDAAYMTLLSILQYLLDTPDCPVKEVRREVFHAINICNGLKSRYAEKEVQ